MPFNANTYRLNQYRKSRDGNIAKVREIKARAEAGDAYQWEIDRIPRLIEMARIDNALVRSQKRIIAISQEGRAWRNA